MAFEVKVLADSLAPCGARCTTYLATYPRVIHAEIMTHRALSKSSASSRAIPTERLIDRVLLDPFIPVYLGKNQPGMQPGEELDEDTRRLAEAMWRGTRDISVQAARKLAELKVHKGVVNRLIEPWMWITVIITGTEWDNFFGLRDHEMAEPHFQHLARMMKAARAASTPKKLGPYDWHLPLFGDNHGSAHDEEDLAKLCTELGIFDYYTMQEIAAKVAVGRCARVSYLTHDGRRDMKDDLKLHDRLLGSDPVHASPAEHVAQALDWPKWFQKISRGEFVRATPAILQHEVQNWQWNRGEIEPPMDVLLQQAALSQLRSGNFLGFKQYRKRFLNEHIGGLVP